MKAVIFDLHSGAYSICKVPQGNSKVTISLLRAYNSMIATNLSIALFSNRYI